MSDGVRTLEAYRLDGYTHLNVGCDNCARMVSLRIATLPVTARGLTMPELAKRMRCKKCDQVPRDVEPWRETMHGRMR
jgi:hypothetical protein